MKGADVSAQSSRLFAILIAWLWASASLAQGADLGANQGANLRLLDQFVDPYQALDCAEFPLFERLKFQRCRFGYLRDIRLYAEQRDALRKERLEIEKSRAWLWFSAPPSIGNCNTVPELEKAKFDYQCAPRAVSDGAVGLFEVKLSQLQSQRDALASRVAIVRGDFERLTARASRVSLAEPQEAQTLREILGKLDLVDRRAALLQRFSLEAQRLQELDLAAMDRIIVAPAPPALDLRRTAEPDAPVIGQTRVDGDVVVVIGEAPGDATTLTLVHDDFGVVFANKSEFYAR